MGVLLARVFSVGVPLGQRHLRPIRISVIRPLPAGIPLSNIPSVGRTPLPRSMSDWSMLRQFGNGTIEFLRDAVSMLLWTLCCSHAWGTCIFALVSDMRRVHRGDQYGMDGEFPSALRAYDR